MRLFALYATSIICGFCMMALELLGGRVLAPVYGSSIDIWAAIISVFILSLSVGYVIGGRIADRMRSNAVLGWLIVVSGIAYLLLPVWALPFMTALGPNVNETNAGVLIAALALFLVPSLMLGAISPILVRLVFVSAERVGRTTGTLYAIGSIGNVLGILVTDYAFLPFFATNPIILAMGVILVALGAAHLAIRIGVDHHGRRDAAVAEAAAPVGAAS